MTTPCHASLHHAVLGDFTFLGYTVIYLQVTLSVLLYQSSTLEASDTHFLMHVSTQAMLHCIRDSSMPCCLWESAGKVDTRASSYGFVKKSILSRPSSVSLIRKAPHHQQCAGHDKPRLRSRDNRLFRLEMQRIQKNMMVTLIVMHDLSAVGQQILWT